MMMLSTGKTMKGLHDRTVTIAMVLISVVITVQGQNIMDQTSFEEQLQQQQQQQQQQEQIQQLQQQEDDNFEVQRDLHNQQEMLQQINEKLSTADMSNLVMNQLVHQPGAPLRDTHRIETRKGKPPSNTSRQQHRNVQIVVRPILTPQKWLRLCKNRPSSARFPGCEKDLLSARKKREEMLRSNLAALLSGLKGSEGRHRLRMPSLRFG